MLEIFNRKAAIALLAAGLATSPALANEPAAATAVIHDGYMNDATSYTVPVQNIQGCYNALSSALATHQAFQNVTMICLDQNGQLAASVNCASEEVGWGSHWKAVCTDTTEKARQYLAPLSPAILKPGPVETPTR